METLANPKAHLLLFLLTVGMQLPGPRIFIGVFIFPNEAGNLILMSHLLAFRKLSTDFFWHRTNKIYL